MPKPDEILPSEPKLIFPFLFSAEFSAISYDLLLISFLLLLVGELCSSFFIVALRFSRSALYWAL